MMNFTTLNELIIPEGSVVEILCNNNTLWTRPDLFNYVSLGDSIAVGQAITDDWEKDYGYDAQYDDVGDASTVIVRNSYTDLITKDLVNVYKDNKVVCKSFAHSGDKVIDLMEKLEHDVVRRAIMRADLVTICIGANNILGVVSEDRIYDYINTGSLAGIESEVQASLNYINTDSNPYSYKSLLDKLYSINPNATYVFTTVYNPYKYLWIKDGHDGFFGSLLNTIPNMDIEVAGIKLLDIDSFLKDSLLGTPIVQQLFSRVNGLGNWVENYINQLDNIIKSKISAFGKSNFIVADTKLVYDPVPNRPVNTEGNRHYNDLVNVEYTQGYDWLEMDWGCLWDHDDDKVSGFWWGLANKYVDLGNYSIDINGLANELVSLIVEKVIGPDIDPHPETFGQYALKRSFTDVLGLEPLNRYQVIYNPNGANGSMSHVVCSVYGGDNNYKAQTTIKANGFTHPTQGYYFTGWNTKADGSGTSYSIGQTVGLNSDLTLYAQWANTYTITFKHSQGDVIQFDSSQTGPQECYALWINGSEQSDLGAFSNSARYINVPYGTSVGVVAQTESGGNRSYITWNGTKVAGSSTDARYSFELKGNVTIEFEWNQWQSIEMDGWLPTTEYISYWNCYITANY